MNEDDNYFRDDGSDGEENASDKGTSKMIQCQQISMYIGEKNGSTDVFFIIIFHNRAKFIKFALNIFNAFVRRE
jgi:hypothetical protein